MHEATWKSSKALWFYFYLNPQFENLKLVISHGTSVNNTLVALNFELGISILTFNPSPEALAPGVAFGLDLRFMIVPMCVLVLLEFILGNKISWPFLGVNDFSDRPFCFDFGVIHSSSHIGVNPRINGTSFVVMRHILKNIAKALGVARLLTLAKPSNDIWLIAIGEVLY